MKGTRRTTFPMILFLIGACSSPTALSEEARMLQVTGIVLDDATREPVPDISVRMNELDWGGRGLQTVRSSITNNDGAFILLRRFSSGGTCDTAPMHFFEIGARSGAYTSTPSFDVVYFEWDGEVVVDRLESSAGARLECGTAHRAIVRIAPKPQS